MALSDVGAQYAGDHAAEVQQRHAAAPAVVAGRLALHAGEAEEATAACGRRGRSGVKLSCFAEAWRLVKCWTGAYTIKQQPQLFIRLRCKTLFVFSPLYPTTI